MKKSSLVMILALVGMVGCHHGKQAEPQKNGMTMRGTEPGQPCVLVGNLVKNCDIDGGVVISKFVECDPLNDFGIKCPAGAKIIGNIGTADGGINVGNDPVYSNNPLSHGNEVVILPKKPAKKPKAKKRYAMDDGDNYREFEVHEQPDLPIPEKAAAPVAMTGDPYHPGSGWNFEMKGSHVVWLKDGGYLCKANDGSQNNSCREVEQGEIDWHAAHPEDYTRSFYKSVEKAK